MIIKKKPKEHTPTAEQPISISERDPDVPEGLRGNAMLGAYHVLRDILSGIKENQDDPLSPPYFKTIKLDNGQLSRIKHDKHNKEYGIVFPAVFIHFVDVHYNIGTGKIAEGKGTMRIHYVLNRLNNSDDGECGEEEGLIMYNHIVEVIESHKSTFPPYISRFQLQYWDQPLSFDDSLQPYWIDYQIWFNDYTTYMYKDYESAYVIVPPFTQHSDQNEEANPDDLPDDTETKFEDVASMTDIALTQEQPTDPIIS